MKKIFSLFLICAAIGANAQVATAYIYPNEDCTAETEIREAENMPTEQMVNLENTLGFFYAGFAQYCRYMKYNVHDQFGKRSIDLMSDLWSGDVAIRRTEYGWFASDEESDLYTRSTPIWFLYYRWLYAVNKAIINYPSAETLEPTAYAELLAIRGYIYSCLANLYGNRSDDAICCPIYTEENYQVRFEQMSTREQVYAQAISDLENALAIMETHQFDSEYKIEIDRDIVHGILAHAYLNAAVGSAAHENEYLQQALTHATTVINDAHYSILPYNELTTNGFNDVESANWIWGYQVDSVYEGALKSFFAHVDIYTYGYAGVGDRKEIDNNLYSGILAWDARRNWFNGVSTQHPLAPVNKFFTSEGRTVISDKKWLSDDVFMRIEALYLIAAEASWRLGDLGNAKMYLYEITDRRCEAGQEADYNTWKNAAATADEIKEQIIYNWRVEMWGEGYAFETMRRWKHERTRGLNHLYKKNTTITEDDIVANYTMPYPYLKDSAGNYMLDSLGRAILFATGEEVTVTFYVEGCEEPQGIYTCMGGDIIEFFMPGEDPKTILWEVINGNKSEKFKGTYIDQWVPNDLTVIAHVNYIDAVPAIQVRPADTQKIFRNGQVLILRGNRTYTLTGQLAE